MPIGTLFCDYNGPMGNRTTSIRFKNINLTAEALAQEVNDIFTETIDQFFYSTVNCIGWRWRDRGTNFSRPVAVTGLWAGSSAGSLQQTDYPRFISIQGRTSASGKRVAQTFYGMNYGMTNLYRLPFAEIPSGPTWQAYIAAIQTLQGFQDNAYNLPASFKAYLNQGYNAYYQRKRRG